MEEMKFPGKMLNAAAQVLEGACRDVDAEAVSVAAAVKNWA